MQLLTKEIENRFKKIGQIPVKHSKTAEKVIT